MTRKFYSNEEKEEFIEEYKRNGGSKAAFARAKGISKHTFSKWFYDSQKRNKSETTPGFIPVKVVSERKRRQNHKSQSNSNIEIKIFDNISAFPFFVIYYVIHHRMVDC